MTVWIVGLMAVLASSSTEWSSASAEWKNGYAAGYRDALSGQPPRGPKGPPSSLVDGAEKHTGGTGAAMSNTAKTETVADLLKMAGAAKQAASSQSEETEKEDADLAGLGVEDGANYSLPKIQGAVFEIREKLRIIRENLTMIHNFNEILKNNTIQDAEFLKSTLNVVGSNTNTIGHILDLYRDVHSDMAEEVVGDSMAATSQCADVWGCSYEDSDCGNEWDAVDEDSNVDLKCQYCIKAGPDPTNSTCTERSEDPCFVACLYKAPAALPGTGLDSDPATNEGLCVEKDGIAADYFQQYDSWSCQTHCMRYFDGANISDYAGVDAAAIDAQAGKGAVCVSDPCQRCTLPTNSEAEFSSRLCTGTMEDGNACNLNCIIPVGTAEDSGVCRLVHSLYFITSPMYDYSIGGTTATTSVGRLHMPDEAFTSRFKCGSSTSISPTDTRGSFFSTGTDGRLCLPQCSGDQLTSRQTCYAVNGTLDECDGKFQVVGGLAMQCLLQDGDLCEPKYGCTWIQTATATTD